jgi:NAD(P)-dependent dehydrogenase (short-subunit alcohol dehydrogenase family)
LDGPLPKWCPAVALSRQDGHHSAVALLLKAALIQVSDYRLLGASGLDIIVDSYIHSFLHYVYGCFSPFCLQGAITSLTKALAIDEAKYNVRVNS